MYAQISILETYVVLLRFLLSTYVVALILRYRSCLSIFFFYFLALGFFENCCSVIAPDPISLHAPVLDHTIQGAKIGEASHSEIGRAHV